MGSTDTGWVRQVDLAPPTLTDNTADADRLIGVLKRRLETDAIDIDLSLLKILPERLRESGCRVRCVLFRDRNRYVLIHIEPAQNPDLLAGLAIDLGTTRVVLRLIDLSSGEGMAESSFHNPQISVGPDILTRIHHAAEPGGLVHLNSLIIDGLNRHIPELCSDCGVSPEGIHLISLAGNTAMTHLFLGLNPRWLIREPYIPVVNRPGLLRAEELGLRVNPRARILVFPNIGSYFGGDLVAGILFSGLNRREEPAILVDVGTNAEVVLGNQNWMIACAGAAGPALEGGVTRMGMIAGPGVIDRVSIDSDTRRFRIETIDGRPPVGICGSGLIDLAAGLFLNGWIDMRGKFVPDVCGDRLWKSDGMWHLEVFPEKESGIDSALSISQADLDSLTRSKAAMYTILETIALSVNMSLADLSRFYVAGTFGSFIKPESAIAIGMLPDLPPTAFTSLGNSSLGGAAMVLSDSGATDEIDAIRDRITYLELNVNQEFMNRFSAAKFYPHTDLSRFPSVHPQAGR
jgi:uncharacterized 2Fe-2S/4Fe-4S cluster protein (DUF4445 family)